LPVDWILLFKHPWIKKASTAYAKMSRAAVPKLCWALDRLDMAHFLTLRHCYFGFDPYLGSHWARSTSRPLCCGDKYYLPHSRAVL